MKATIIQQKIYEVRDYKIMFDFDLSELYQVETKALNQAVRRNIDRFPKDFMFQLTKKEWQNLRSQFVTSSWGGIRYLPYAFTEHGITMLASVLHSQRAVRMNIAIVRAFIALREIAKNYKELAVLIKELEKKYDRQFTDIYEALQLLAEEKQRLLAEEKKLQDDFVNRERIGFKPLKNKN
jgi:hypothetical protein